MNTKTTATLAVAVVAMMVFAAAGATTYSWFSDTESTDIEVSTATVDLGASYKYTTTVVGEGKDWTEMTYDDGNGNVSKSIGEIKNLTDNDSITVYIGEFENNASIPIDYYFKVKITAGDAIDTGALTINGAEVPALAENGYVEYLIYSQFAIPVGGEPDVFDFTISTVNNKFQQGDNFQLSFTSVAYQSNAPVEKDMPEALAVTKNISSNGSGGKGATVNTIDPNTDSKITVSASVPSTVDVDKFIVQPKTSGDGVITLGLTMKKGDESVTTFATPVTITVTVPYAVDSIKHIKSGGVEETITPTYVADTKYTYTFDVTGFSDFVLNKAKVVIGNVAYGTLQDAVDAAVNGNVITILDNLKEDVTVSQKPNVKITIDGNKNTFAGVIIVDGKSARYDTAGLTIQNVNFNATSVSADAYINLGKEGDINNTRYTNHVTVKDCTFSYSGTSKVAAVKSYTGGDWNLTFEGCIVYAGMHSALQVTNVEKGLKVVGCEIYSKNGINLNSTPSAIIDGCKFDVMGYAVRVGVDGSTYDGATFNIRNSTLKSDCDDGDAVIIFRGTYNNSGLIIDAATKLEGDRLITNNSGATVQVGGVMGACDANALAKILRSDAVNIEVILMNDIDLPISSLGQQTGGSGEYKLGGVNTERITIDLNGNKLNITTTYWSAIGAKNDNAIFTIMNGTMTSSQSTGTWNSYDVTFANCDYVIEDVVFDKAIAFTNVGKKVTLKDVTINESHDYYAIWISAEGQTVDIDGLTVNSDGRGIKIDEQYVDAPAKVKLSVKNSSFETVNKAAILVKSAAGAEITIDKVDISKVKADSTNAVWVDEDAAAYSDLVKVTGGNVIVEP